MGTMSLGQVLHWAVQVFVVLIIVECIVSWLMMTGNAKLRYNPLVKWVHRIVDPVLAPIRRVLPPYKTGGLDLSPMIVIVALQFIGGLLSRL